MSKDDDMQDQLFSVILIEDDQNDAALIEGMMESPRAGMALSRADRLSKGLHLIETRDFDVVLLDLGLPDSSGMDALRQVQLKAPNLPVIILTGMQDEELAAEAIMAGAQDYVVKGDFDRKLLRRCILYAIQRKQAQYALERAHGELELRVRERTQDLEISNLELAAEVDQHKQTTVDLMNSREQLRDLAAHLQTVREEDRTNIAREIHDELGQALTALKMDLFWMKGRLNGDQEQLAGKMNSDIGLIDGTISSVKRIITELRPAILDNLGLEAALEWQCEEFQKRTGIACLIYVGNGNPVEDKDLKTALFRIYQEILTNVLRHSKAKSVVAFLQNSRDLIRLEVRDDGIGIEPEHLSKANSFGLLGMHERVYPWGGRVDIKGEKGKGTTVTAIIPLNGGG